MAYSDTNYPQAWKSMPANVRTKAIELCNKLLKQGKSPAQAEAMAAQAARVWGKHQSGN